MRKGIILFFAIFLAVSTNGQTTVKTMFYNLLNYGADQKSRDRTPYLKTILDDVKPDLFMVCELKEHLASDYMFNNAIVKHNANYKAATYEDAKSGGYLQQMVYYNRKKLVLEKYNAVVTSLRDINHYTFKLNTTSLATNPIRIEVFITHLKALRGYYDRQRKLTSVNEFVKELDKLDKDSHVIFAGDFNFYTSNEVGYQKIIDPNNSINIIDPINSVCPVFPNDGVDYYDYQTYDSTYFWNNSNYETIHTQSTRSAAGSDGAGGGMDDRFDFIMMSKNFNATSSRIKYKAGSYKAIGNNGNCYNGSVSDSNCSGTYSQGLRNALYEFSDHLPVVMDIETVENVLSTSKIKQPISIISEDGIQNYLTIKFTQNLKVKTIRIYNNLGQLVDEIQTKNQSQLKINTSHFAKGMYFLKASAYQSLKFIKS